MAEVRCLVCDSERISSFGSCANCGERLPAVGLEIAIHEDALPDYCQVLSADSATITRALLEAPYQRLAIFYRKAKRRAGEERVVRLALVQMPCGPTSWFVLRLVKIIGARNVER
jgi:hypothetical protein